jgi:predicted TIM-barrel fold metal-dependent hydrolase
MRVIDAHVHLYPPEAGREPIAWAAAHGEAHWAALCTRRRPDGDNGGRPVQGFPSVDELLRDMDAAGVAKAVLLGWYWENQATGVIQNRFYAECVRAHPDRLAAFATLHPAAGRAALEEIRRAAGEGLIGLGELSPHSQHFGIDDPVWQQILALAGELHLPVNLHVTDPASRRFPGRVDTPPGDFVQLAREFPQTTFILAHWGGGPAYAAELGALPNVYFDTAASPLLYAPAVVRQMLTALPAGKVLYGSDYPLILYPKTETAPGFAGVLGELKTAGASAEVLGGNAARVLVL